MALTPETHHVGILATIPKRYGSELPLSKQVLASLFQQHFHSTITISHPKTFGSQKGALWGCKVAAVGLERAW